jgi:hypothetical protein
MAFEKASGVVATPSESRGRPPYQAGAQRRSARASDHRESGSSASSGPATTSRVGKMKAKWLASGTSSQPARQGSGARPGQHSPHREVECRDPPPHAHRI